MSLSCAADNISQQRQKVGKSERLFLNINFFRTCLPGRQAFGLADLRTLSTSVRQLVEGTMPYLLLPGGGSWKPIGPSAPSAGGGDEDAGRFFIQKGSKMNSGGFDEGFDEPPPF